jgi:hypothetical protein
VQPEVLTSGNGTEKQNGKMENEKLNETGKRN